MRTLTVRVEGDPEPLLVQHLPDFPTALEYLERACAEWWEREGWAMLERDFLALASTLRPTSVMVER